MNFNYDMRRVSRPFFKNHPKMPKIRSETYFWLIKTILKSKIKNRNKVRKNRAKILKKMLHENDE